MPLWWFPMNRLGSSGRAWSGFVLLLAAGVLIGALSRLPLAFVANQFEHPVVEQMQFTGTVWQGRIYLPGAVDPVALSWDWWSLLKGKPAFRLAFSTENTALGAALGYAQGQWVLNDLSGTHQVNTAQLPAALVGQAIGPVRFSADQLVLDGSEQMIAVDLPVADQHWSGVAVVDGRLAYRAVIEPPAQQDIAANLVVTDRWPFSDRGAQWRLAE